MKRAFLALAAVGAVALAGRTVPVSAHHSFAADYFEDRSVTVEGELVEFEYRTPHAWVHVMAPDENGQMVKFSAEWFSATRLKSQGITPETLKVGDRLVLNGAPGRKAGEHKIHLKVIERPSDGWKYGGGGPGRGRGFPAGRGGPGGRGPAGNPTPGAPVPEQGE